MVTNLAVRYDNFFQFDYLIIENKNLNSFMNVFNLENLIKTPTCFKKAIIGFA